MNTVIFILAAYLIGSVSFAVLTSKMFGLPDPRTFGSKNPGATNVLRTGKKLAAAVTLLGDGAKGWLAVFLALRLAPVYGLDETVVAASAIGVFLGHVYPIFFGFHGGKGVATVLGILLALNPWLGLAALATWLLATYMWRISSLSALIAAVFTPLYAWLWLKSGVLVAAVAAVSLLLIWRHKSNIQNLLSGKEHAIGKTQPGDAPPQ
ncbi:MAG: glycerol-3-phosphate 1-O-acyltransferase PlsY [Gammaproteobacteria bacterium]|nr:glycerol-3-phosphate 1-O-acyltransferase PlsY [Gammaproteobacteria bacterium]MBU1978756.1 glycerol-3-phosphate 1-O-acyltransferase PlsY [Gammaproteobacteria bacterium]